MSLVKKGERSLLLHNSSCAQLICLLEARRQPSSLSTQPAPSPLAHATVPRLLDTCSRASNRPVTVALSIVAARSSRRLAFLK
eukprot:4478650-Pleurochrysis_carterae.AAC.1